MATPTLEDMLSWPEPDYENPRNTLDVAIYVVEGFLLALMTFFIVGRFYSRTILVKNALGADDWVMLLAYFLAAAMTACHLYGPTVGIGHHLYDVPLTKLPDVGKFTLITMALFGPACAVAKISVCLTYLRLFPSQTNRYINWGCIGVMAGWGASTFIVMMLQCRPLSDVWNIFTPMEQKKCINTQTFFIIAAAINTVTDCLIYLYPANYLWRVRLSLKKRISLILCFSLGAVVTIAGGFRIWVLHLFFRSWDQTYLGGVIYLILAVEVNLGVVFGCLPAMRPIMSRIFPRAWDSTAGHSAANVYLPKSTATASSGFRGFDRDPESIHVQKDVELSVSTKTYDPYSTRENGREGSEEWVFRNDTSHRR